MHKLVFPCLITFGIIFSNYELDIGITFLIIASIFHLVIFSIAAITTLGTYYTKEKTVVNESLVYQTFLEPLVTLSFFLVAAIQLYILGFLLIAHMMFLSLPITILANIVYFYQKWSS